MGFYIDPPDMSKEKWLQENAKPCHRPVWPPPEGHIHVVLIFNQAFTAAGVAFSKKELEAFLNPRDSRVRLTYLAPIKKVEKVQPHGIKEFYAQQKETSDA